MHHSSLELADDSIRDLATLDAPPQDIDAERFVIGAAMMSQPALRDCRDLLADDGNDFNIPYTPMPGD